VGSEPPPAAPAGTTGSVEPNDSGFDPALGRALQQALDEERERFAALGASAAVVVPGRGIWIGGSGVADRDTQEPVTPETLFAFGSVTKTFVAALVLDLSEEGLVSLDDPLARWLPDFPRARRITIRHLLGHTSGVYEVVESRRFIEEQLARPRVRWSPERVLGYVGEPLFAPGTDWSYSNTNYVLLGRVVEEATGVRVSRELRRRILRPAEADAAFLAGEDRVRGPVARAYFDRDLDGDDDDLSDGTRVIPNTALATAAWTAGGLIATPEAVARFGDAVFRGRLLEPASLEAMLDFDARGAGEGAGRGYGFGVSSFELPRHEVYGHGGAIPGYRAALWHAPEHGITLALAWNDERLDPTLVAQRLLDLAVESSRDR
jgi:D-alanyl-D-alanine carboxypeptidase